MTYQLHVFGDFIAKRENYKNAKGLDAIHLYLINKFSWQPRDVRSMSYEDILLVLIEEMANWTLPAAARI